MVSDQDMRNLFENNRSIAVYGMSTDPEKPSQAVPVFLQSKGYDVIPVNPRADTIINLKSYPNLHDVEANIDVVDVFRPSDQTVAVVEEAVQRNRERGDVRVIWLQEGIVNQESQRLAEQAGLVFIQDRCMKKEYKRIFEQEIE
ncbi:MAG: CoA-binding protein [Chloroflexota bacterium]|nr:CoA-binding protein [Chloroflexota bacterium]